MKTRLPLLLFLALTLVALPSLAQKTRKAVAKQVPAMQKVEDPAVIKLKSGYDLAVVELSSAGPEGKYLDSGELLRPNAPVVVIENKGSLPVNQGIDMDLWYNEMFAGSELVHVRLLPGQRQTWSGGPETQGLFPWGTVAKVELDPKDALHDDDRTNNTLTHALLPPRGSKLPNLPSEEKPVLKQVPSENPKVQDPPVLTSGNDLAVVELSSTGPEGTPPDTLVVVIENKGRRSVDLTLALDLWANGVSMRKHCTWCNVHVQLQPGQRQTAVLSSELKGLFPWGTVAKVELDPFDVLHDDDRTNNTLTRTLQPLSSRLNPRRHRP